MPTGIGGEQLWLSPTVANNVNPFDDQSGQGNNGTNNGSTVVADSASGGSYAYHADAASQTVIVSGFGQNLSETTTISLWLKSVNPWVCVPVAQGGLGYSTSVWQYAVFNSGTTRILRRRNANLSFSNPSPSNQWQHICIVRETGSSTQEVYIDGVLDVSSASNTATYGTNQMWFGFGNAVGTNEEIYLDDMRTYGRAITQAEITHLATSRGVLGPPGGATHYNPFKSHAFINDFQQRLR